MNRRQFLKLGLGLGASFAGSLWLPDALQSQAFAAENISRGLRTVDLYRPETRERLSVNYMLEGEWLSDSYARLCWLLRDIKAHQYVQMDPTLIAILDWTQDYLRQFGYTEPIHILSGYRSMTTNLKTEGAARNSQHLYGKAVDFRVPGLPAAYLGKLMAWLSQGGVGVYESGGFVHVDTGRVRFWRGHPGRSK